MSSSKAMGIVAVSIRDLQKSELQVTFPVMCILEADPAAVGGEEGFHSSRLTRQQPTVITIL